MEKDKVKEQERPPTDQAWDTNNKIRVWIMYSATLAVVSCITDRSTHILMALAPFSPCFPPYFPCGQHISEYITHNQPGSYQGLATHFFAVCSFCCQNVGGTTQFFFFTNLIQVLRSFFKQLSTIPHSSRMKIIQNSDFTGSDLISKIYIICPQPKPN